MRDAVLPTLDRVLRSIERKAPSFAAKLNRDGYIQLLNVSYVCKTGDDKGSAIKQWRAILEYGLDRDDVPADPSKVRFVVFGWGGKFSDSEDGIRIAKGLTKLATTTPLDLFFPSAIGTVGSPDRKVRIARIRSPDVSQEIRKQIVRGGIYPRGSKTESTSFPRLYVRALSRALSQSLLRSVQPR